MLHKLTNHLFVGSPNIGGTLATDSKVKGYTELKKDGVLYRAHSSHKMRGSWYDWNLFNWVDFSDPIPAKMIIMIDLTECVILNDTDINPDASDVVQQSSQYLHLTPEMWVVVLAAKNSELNHNELPTARFNSNISTWFELHKDTDVYIVLWSTLVGPCFIFQNKDYKGLKLDGKYECDTKVCHLLPMSNWGDKFL